MKRRIIDTALIALMVAALLVVVIGNAHGESVPDEPTYILVEKNTWGKFSQCPITKEWKFKQDGVQFIFWGWRCDERGYGWEVREWVPVDHATLAGDRKSIHVKTGSIDVVIPIVGYEETRTGFDPEVYRRDVTKVSEREGLW